MVWALIKIRKCESTNNEETRFAMYDESLSKMGHISVLFQLIMREFSVPHFYSGQRFNQQSSRSSSIKWILAVILAAIVAPLRQLCGGALEQPTRDNVLSCHSSVFSSRIFIFWTRVAATSEYFTSINENFHIHLPASFIRPKIKFHSNLCLYLKNFGKSVSRTLMNFSWTTNHSARIFECCASSNLDADLSNLCVYPGSE